MVAGVAQGADIRYRQSGDWTETAPLDNQPGWRLVSSVPTTADMGVINWGGNTVTLTTTESIGELRVGQDEVGNLIVANGATLTTVVGPKNGRLTLGQGNNPAGTGTMTVLSGGTVNVGNILYNGNKANGTADIWGTVNVGSHLWTGWTAGITGTYNIYDGGVLNVTGMLGLDWQNNGAIGLLNVNDGGTLNLAQIHADGLSIQGASLLTIGGSGKVYKTDNFVNVIQTMYIDTGKIVGAGGAPLSVSYDGDLNKTLISVLVPEPSTFALTAFMGVGLLLRRLGRKS
jgi:hypothetical protein